jgi:murein DD-endopeptidase MepM/ murein hydrolase activator NlpD
MSDYRGVSLGAVLDQFHSNTVPNVAAAARVPADFKRPMPPADWRERSQTPNLWPVDGRITGDFGTRIDPFNGEGTFHRGIDIASSYGHSVAVAADGVVIYADSMGGYGRMIVIEHSNGFATRYGHLSEFAVVEGQSVKCGDILGYVGMSGRATGPHLHYEVWLHDTPVNPHPYLRITQAQFYRTSAGD